MMALVLLSKACDSSTITHGHSNGLGFLSPRELSKRLLRLRRAPVSRGSLSRPDLESDSVTIDGVL